MAKLKNGILGAISGTLGPVVGATWKGVHYVRMRPKKKKTKRPRTPAQLANEQRFKFIQQWLVPFYPFIMVGFKNKAVDRTEINAAYAANHKTVFSGLWPDLSIDYSKVLLSDGTLPGLHSPVLSRIDTDTVKLDWKNLPSYQAAYDDQLMLVLYCPELQMADGFIGGIKRNALTCTFQFVKELEGKMLEVYVGVTSSDRKRIATSIYLGKIEP